MSKILCIDPGTKNLGLAVSDPGRVIVFAKEVVPNSTDGISRIKQICHDEKIGLIVIGKPLYSNSLNQSEQIKTELSELNIETIFFNEDYSTSEAFEIMEQAGLDKQTQQKMKDAFAAKLILEKYLVVAGEGIEPSTSGL